MKTAKEILECKNYTRFDLGKACDEIERYFEEADANSKLVVKGRTFDDIRPDADFPGYFMYIDDAVDHLVNSEMQLEKIGRISSCIAIIDVEGSCVRKLIDELKKNGFFSERISQGTYVVSII